jgi:hypothetical protein
MFIAHLRRFIPTSATWLLKILTLVVLIFGKNINLSLSTAAIRYYASMQATYIALREGACM